ncbi:uncharacterized protein [Parasteatoda tepidariorum]
MLEVREWPKLNHQNILRLLETILNVEGAVIFITEIMDTNLFLFLQKKPFRNDPFAPEKCRLFARQVFSGLAYLHERNLCHLDIRAENIFVASDSRVTVADFSGLTYAEEAKRFCPLPRSLRPPELLTTKKIKVAPMPVDLWSCGLLLAYMFIGKGYYNLTVRNSKAGSIEAVKDYMECFASKKYVTSFLSATYPNCKVSEIKISELITFMGLFLQMQPTLRISAAEALEHSFMSNCVTEVLPGMPCAIKESKTPTATIDQLISDHQKEVRSDAKLFALDMELEESDKNINEKISAWIKYKPTFENIRKTLQHVSSSPLFKNSKSRTRTVGTQISNTNLKMFVPK